ncbi:O-antigen polymerase [Photobacterium ganghwense]|uniref:O-antigen polymerase n=1 Tax=Photobacterium ganghwense TaxID=320778 RepID=UPI001C2D7B36|nr:O-antigen polymerase [Photobacterium ganghwense]MBV1838981.1 oligosaccharide repeat unit polymerase [Photobacterium ganghwense]
MVKALIFFVIVFVCCVVFSSKVKMNKLLKFSLFTQLLFLSISVINIYDLSYSPTYSALLICACIMFLCIGHFTITTILTNTNTSTIEYSVTNDIQYEKVIKLLFLIIIMPLLFYALKAINIYTNVIPIYNYRRELFESGGGLLFEYKILFPVFELIVGGSIQIILLMSLYLFFFESKKKFIIIALLLTILHSVIFLGRFPLYRLVSLFFVFYLVSDKKQSGNIIPIVFLGSLTSALIIFSIYRGGVDEIFSVFLKYVVGYNTFSFNLFEYSVLNTDVINGESTLGLATFGSLGYFISLPITWFTSFETYMQSEVFYNQDDFIWLGFMDGVSIDANAFYTMYQEVFFDFGILSPLIFFFVGAIISWVDLKALTGSKIYIFLSIYISSIFLFGNLKNPLIMHSYVLPVIFVLVVIFWRNFKCMLR